MAIYITEGYVYYNKDFTSKAAARRRIDDDESRRHESMQRQSTYATAVENVQERAPMQATEHAELLFGCLPIPSPGGHCTQLRTWVHNLLMPRPASRPGLGTTIRLWYYHAYLRSQNGHRSSTDTHNWIDAFRLIDRRLWLPVAFRVKHASAAMKLYVALEVDQSCSWIDERSWNVKFDWHFLFWFIGTFVLVVRNSQFNKINCLFKRIWSYDAFRISS